MEPEALLATDLGLVAAAYDSECQCTRVWSSDDGLSWTELPRDGDLSGDGIFDAVARDRTIVAADAYGKPTIVVSTDGGRRWTRVRLPAARAAAAVDLQGVVATPTGIVIGGNVRFGDLSCVNPTGPSSNYPTVWSSRDGQSWRSVTLTGGAGGELELQAVLAGRGGLLAEGYRVHYTSSDGRSWSRSPSLGFQPLWSNGTWIVKMKAGRSGTSFVISGNGRAWRPLPATAGQDAVPITAENVESQVLAILPNGIVVSQYDASDGVGPASLWLAKAVGGTVGVELLTAGAGAIALPDGPPPTEITPGGRFDC